MKYDICYPALLETHISFTASLCVKDSNFMYWMFKAWKFANGNSNPMLNPDEYHRMLFIVGGSQNTDSSWHFPLWLVPLPIRKLAVYHSGVETNYWTSLENWHVYINLDLDHPLIEGLSGPKTKLSFWVFFFVLSSRWESSCSPDPPFFLAQNPM